jgi:hypothetical protein
MFKRILNFPEEATYDRLHESCARNGAQVFPKIRLADVLPVEGSGISDDLFRFALQSHFDFVVANLNHLPLFAVEFDGESHKDPTQKSRDIKKLTLCDKFSFPILRINSKYINRKYRNLDLLTWIVETWFARTMLNAATERDELPEGAVDPWMLIEIPGLKGPNPLLLSAEPLAKLKELNKGGKCLDWVPNLFVGQDGDEVYRGIAYLRINKQSGVIVDSAMQKQRFPINEYELLYEILTFEVYQRLLDVLERDEESVFVDRIHATISAFSKYVRHLSFSCSFDFQR